MCEDNIEGMIAEKMLGIAHLTIHWHAFYLYSIPMAKFHKILTAEQRIKVLHAK